MKYLNLGGIKISRIGFGCCPLGGHGWGKEVSESVLFSAINRALDLGINFFDTADVYGLGMSEQRLGKIVKNRRDKIVLATKGGVRFDSAGKTFYDNSEKWIRNAINQSLKRLDTEYIDLYQIHYWDKTTAWDDILNTLEHCKTQGKIRKYGVTNIDLCNSQLISSSVASFSYEYSLLKKEHEISIRETLRKRNDLIFLSWGSLAQGLLSGKYDYNSVFSQSDRRSRTTYPNFHSSQFKMNLALIEFFSEFRDKYYPEISLTQLAICWILDTFCNSISLVGIKTPEQISEIALATQRCIQNSHKKILDEKFFEIKRHYSESNV